MKFLAFAALVLANPAAAADRVFSVGTFEKVRIDGPFEVRIVTGGSPQARASGDRQLIDQLDVAVNGTTLTVRLNGSGWGEMPKRQLAASPVITLSTPRLLMLSVNAGGRASVNRMASQRIDVTVIGSGTVTLDKVDADQLNAALTGSGTMTIAGGRANRATLLADGSGVIDSAGVTVNDLTVRLEGAGEVRAAARYTAAVTSTGLGRVSVAGTAKCVVKAAAGGPVSCGAVR